MKLLLGIFIFCLSHWALGDTLVPTPNVLDRDVYEIRGSPRIQTKDAQTPPEILFSPQVKTLWAKYLSGAPGLFHPRYQLERLLQMRDKCRPVAQELTGFLDQYARETALAHLERANWAYRNLSFILNREKAKKESGCFREAAQTYAVGSLVILDSKNDPHWRSTQKERRFSAPRNLSLAYLGAYLVNSGRILFLEGSLDPKKKRRFLGAYQCQSSQIYLDPWIEPYNLGSVFLHELNHLFVDKFVSGFPKDANGWRRFLLIDETLAFMHAAHRQRVLDYQVLPFIPPTIKIPRGLKLPYRSENGDISQFNPNGLFMELWSVGKYRPTDSLNLALERIAFGRELTPADPHYWKGIGPDGYYFFLGFNFLRKTLRDEHLHIDIPKKRDVVVSKIYHHFYKAYFGKDKFDFDARSLNPESLEMNLAPLAVWLEKAERYYIHSGHHGELDLKFGELPVEFATYSTTMKFDVLPILKWFDLNHEKFLSTSDSCKEFSKQQNALSDYIGSPQNTRHGESGTRPQDPSKKPGESGTRPKNPSKPGESGTRPEDPLHKPGESGTRPSGPVRF